MVGAPGAARGPTKAEVSRRPVRRPSGTPRRTIKASAVSRVQSSPAQARRAKATPGQRNHLRQRGSVCPGPPGRQTGAPGEVKRRPGTSNIPTPRRPALKQASGSDRQMVAAGQNQESLRDAKGKSRHHSPRRRRARKEDIRAHGPVTSGPAHHLVRRSNSVLAARQAIPSRRR